MVFATVDGAPLDATAAGVAMVVVSGVGGSGVIHLSVEWAILFGVHNECASTTEAQSFSNVYVAKHACIERLSVQCG